jgi:hypothetical protein
MSREDDVLRMAKVLMEMGVLANPVLSALGVAVAKYSPKLVEAALRFTSYPIIFKGHIVDYSDPCGICAVCGGKKYRLMYLPSLAYCPMCSSLQPADDDEGGAASSATLLAY